MFKQSSLLLGLMLLGLLAIGCTDRRAAASDEEAQTDSLAGDSLATDTIADLVEDAPLPKAVDELFDDFFFNFAGNRRMQMSRIAFPLAVVKGGQTAKLQRGQWRYSHFFMAEGFYMLLFDDIRQDSLSKSYGLRKASVEKLYLREDLMKEYDFRRDEGGQWQLVRIEHKPLGEHPCADFLHFYERFASDTAFQVRSLDEFVVMTAPDSDDEEDSGEVTGSIMPEQWPSFKPEIIPQGIVYCVNYGQHYSNDRQKVVVVRGVANGLSIEMTFHRKSDGWKLVRFMV